MILPSYLNNAAATNNESVLSAEDLENILTKLTLGGIALESSVQQIITTLPTNPASREDVYAAKEI